jgi:hypothetical protein
MWKKKLNEHHRQFNSTYYSTDSFNRFIRTYHLTDSFDILFDRPIRFIRQTDRRIMVYIYIWLIKENINHPLPEELWCIYIYIIYTVILRVGGGTLQSKEKIE